jgi:hypothetical protein
MALKTIDDINMFTVKSLETENCTAALIITPCLHDMLHTKIDIKPTSVAPYMTTTLFAMVPAALVHDDSTGKPPVAITFNGHCLHGGILVWSMSCRHGVIIKAAVQFSVSSDLTVNMFISSMVFSAIMSLAVILVVMKFTFVVGIVFRVI